MKYKKIAFDILGADCESEILIDSAISFIEENSDVEITLIGDEKVINTKINNLNDDIKSRIKILNTNEYIKMTDSVLEIRRKENSSMNLGLKKIKENSCDAFLTAGNSGALLISSHFMLGKINNVKKGAFMALIPNINQKYTLLLDVGANTENTVEDLINYAKMGNIYYLENYKKDNPNIALLNIGTEKHKGKILQIETYDNLSNMKEINFIGNIEPSEIFLGKADVIVTDGFTGNIALKSCEGTAKILLSQFKKNIDQSLLLKMSKNFDYTNNAGAILIGVDGLVIKTHGSGNFKSFKSALRIAYENINNNVLEKIKKNV